MPVCPEVKRAAIVVVHPLRRCRGVKPRASHQRSGGVPEHVKGELPAIVEPLFASSTRPFLSRRWWMARTLTGAWRRQPS